MHSGARDTLCRTACSHNRKTNATFARGRQNHADLAERGAASPKADGTLVSALGGGPSQKILGYVTAANQLQSSCPKDIPQTRWNDLTRSDSGSTRCRSRSSWCSPLLPASIRVLPMSRRRDSISWRHPRQRRTERAKAKLLSHCCNT